MVTPKGTLSTSTPLHGSTQVAPYLTLRRQRPTESIIFESHNTDVDGWIPREDLHFAGLVHAAIPVYPHGHPDDEHLREEECHSRMSLEVRTLMFSLEPLPRTRTVKSHLGPWNARS